jgi:hypothetical protein
MTTQEDYEDDPIRSLPIHEVEDYHFLERNVSLSDQPAGEWRDNTSFMDLPIHEVEQPHFLESDVSLSGQPAGEWRDNKSVVEATYESVIHTKSSEDISEDISDDEEEEESKRDGFSDDRDIDALIASELNKMTLKEREEVMFDVHGISEVIEEVPDMVARKFDELASILAKKRLKKKAAAYNLAVSMSPDYVHNRKFLLMFLRADRFHAKKAAGRVITHFQKKLELFGASKLCKDITLEDLDSCTMEVLERGYLTVLPARDQADRMVCCCAVSHQRYKEPIDHVRLLCLFLHPLKCGRNLRLIFRNLVHRSVHCSTSSCPVPKTKKSRNGG